MSPIHINGITEDLEKRLKGVKISIPDVGDFYIRRGGLSAWQNAIKEATENVLENEYSFNEIDPRQNEKITALACADYVVAGWDNLVDADGNEVSYSNANARNLLLPEENYSLVEFLVKQSNYHHNFLLRIVKEEAEELKKSSDGN